MNAGAELTAAVHGDDRMPASTAVKRHALLLAGAVAAAALGLILWSRASAAAGQLDLRRARAGRLADDARAVARLRERPRQARDASLPQSDLLARVTRAMQEAQLDPASLVSTLPEPARQAAGSDVAEVSQRLMLQDVELEKLVRFCQALGASSPELRIGALQLRAAADRTRWNVDLSVGFFLYAPRSHVPASAKMPTARTN